MDIGVIEHEGGLFLVLEHHIVEDLQGKLGKVHGGVGGVQERLSFLFRNTARDSARQAE